MPCCVTFYEAVSVTEARVGPVLGTFVSGIVVTEASWRVVFWLQTLPTGVAAIESLCLLPETTGDGRPRRLQPQRKFQYFVESDQPMADRSLCRCSTLPTAIESSQLGLRGVVGAIKAFPIAIPFCHPFGEIWPQVLTEHQEKIGRPMDLTTIERKVCDGEYWEKTSHSCTLCDR